MKTIIRVFSVLLVFALAVPALAASDRLVPVGKAVGLDLDAQGVLVVGFPEGKRSPAREAGVETGDLIVAVNGSPVDGSQDMTAAAEAMDGAPVTLTLLRGDGEISLAVTPQMGQERYELGLYLRDGISGVGTVTYYDPETGAFGALGHAVTDPETGTLVPISGGSVYGCTVSGVIPGAEGTPGQLVGEFSTSEDVGSVTVNTDFGVFGTLDFVPEGEALELAAPEEVRTGRATILSNVSGDEVREYDVEISRIYTGLGQRGMMLTVTDPELIEQTGGIVQGMSGSPILQDGKLVGAVTHVLLKDPTRGYGAFIDSMIEQAA